MLLIKDLEEINALRCRIPELIQSLEERDSNFVPLVKEWLKQTEKILNNNKPEIASELAILRGVLIEAERGVRPEGIVIKGRLTKRKLTEATAVYVLRKSNESISNSTQSSAAQITEAELLTRQLVAMAKRKGLIEPYKTIKNNTTRLKEIWKAMSMDANLATPAAHLAGLVSKYDILILIDRKLDSTA